MKCTELRCDQRIRECAVQKSDERILAIVSRDIVAAEAHYHHSCYRLCTKTPESSADDVATQNEEDCLYIEVERQAYESIYTFI